MIFGVGNVIDASMCFGPGARRTMANIVWRLKWDIASGEDVGHGAFRDLARGERLMAIVDARPVRRRPLPRFLRTAHGDGPEAA